MAKRGEHVVYIITRPEEMGDITVRGGRILGTYEGDFGVPYFAVEVDDEARMLLEIKYRVYDNEPMGMDEE